MCYKNSIINLSILLFISISGCTLNETAFSSGFVKAGGLKIYYEQQGKGETVMLLHAGLQEHTMWKEQVDMLSKYYSVVTIDMPYHGQSGGADTTILIQDVIRTILDTLHIKKTNIAGLSMGASAVQDFIIAYPERVNKAILISAGVNGLEDTMPIDSISMNWYLLFSKALKNKDTAAAAKEFTKAWAEGIYRSGDSLQQPVSKYVYATTLANLKQHKMETWPKLNDSPKASEKLQDIQISVLIINGDKDLPYVTTASNYMEKNIPHARHIVMKDVAHMLNMEKPEELNKIILDFLKE